MIWAIKKLCVWVIFTHLKKTVNSSLVKTNPLAIIIISEIMSGKDRMQVLYCQSRCGSSEWVHCHARGMSSKLFGWNFQAYKCSDRTCTVLLWIFKAVRQTQADLKLKTGCVHKTLFCKFSCIWHQSCSEEPQLYIRSSWNSAFHFAKLISQCLSNKLFLHSGHLCIIVKIVTPCSIRLSLPCGSLVG